MLIVVKLRCLAGACVMLLMKTAGAQQPLPLPTILDLLQQNAPQLISDSAAIEIFEQRAEATRYNWLPNLDVNLQGNLGTNNNLPGGFFSNGLVPSNSRVREVGSSRTILTDLGVASFDWEVYNFGAYTARNRVAVSDLQVQRKQYKQSRYQLQQAGIDVYLKLILLNEMVGIQEQNILRSEEIKKTINALAVSGIKAGVDTSIAAAELSSAKLLRLDLLKQYRQLQLHLSYFTGLPAENIIADSLLEDKIISRYIAFLEEQNGAEEHPLLQYFDAIKTNSLEKENQIKKDYNPRILLQASVWGRGSSLSAEDIYRPLYAGVGFERVNYLMGVGISYNIFDYKRKQLQLNIQKANTRYAEKKLEEQTAMLKNERKQNMVELTTAYHRLQEIPRQLEAATAAYRQKLSLYKNGLTDIIELNLTLNVLYRAETDYAQAKFNFSKAVFDQAMLENQLPALLQTLK